MKTRIPRILIGAIKSGSGKTVVTCALLEALKNRGKEPKAFKCGPDYIDPMFHKKIIDIPSYNLDSFFLREECLRAVFARNGENAGIGVLEGVMGLFDGLGGILEEGSSYEVAKILKTPIILVVDAHGMGRSILPILSGLLQYDKENLIRGVILNRTTKGFFETIKPVIEKELPLSVLGYFPTQKELHLESRHLGLKMPDEIFDLKEQVKKAAGVLEETVELEKIIAVAERASEIEYEPVFDRKSEAKGNEGNRSKKQLENTSNVKIAVAKDEAFCFYYEDNLRMLEEMGAELVEFSPLHDEKLPAGIHGILLGGGYPELYARQLSENFSMKKAIKEAIDNKMPSVAECGGFMYLHRNLVTKEGETFEMCSVLPEDCFFTGKLVRFGYVTVEEKTQDFWTGGQGIRGHEFHYFDSSKNGEDCIATKPVTGRNWPCVHADENHWWGFPHLYYPANSAFAEHFVEAAGRYKESLGNR